MQTVISKEGVRMNAKLINISRGDTRCDHCNRSIKILCTIEQEGVRKTVGSSCIEKFVPELAGALTHKMRIFNAAQRREKKLLAQNIYRDQKRREFEAKMTGSEIEGENLVKITDLEMLHGLVQLLQDDGFDLTDDETVMSAPTPEALKKAVKSYEGVAEVEPSDSPFSEAVEHIRNYTGNFEFFNSLKRQLQEKGFLSDNQVNAVVRCLEKQKPTQEPIILSEAVITVSRWCARNLAMAAGLKSAHFNFRVFKILRETGKAYHLELQATGKPTGRCCICGLTLTNDDSIKLGIGPICLEKVGFTDWGALDRELQEKSVAFSAWVPKRSIKEAVGLPGWSEAESTLKPNVDYDEQERDGTVLGTGA